MKLVSWAPALFILFALLTDCSHTEQQKILTRKFLEPIKESRQDAYFYMARSNMPGSSIAVSVEGKLVWSEGFGYASRDLKVPASRVTRYRIGEVTQVLTALTYQLLAEQGKLHPDSTVQHYYPDFPLKKYRLTVRNLAEQTSGIRPPTDEEKIRKSLNVGLEAGLDCFKNDSLLFMPGSFQFPSIYNYNLLGMVIQKATGKRFSDVVKELVTDTLGMKETVPDNLLGVIENRADFFDHDYMSRIIHAVSTDNRYKMPSEGYLSTAEDLNRLGTSLLFSEYIPGSVKNKIFEQVKLPGGPPTRWANGWFHAENESGNSYYFITGNITGGGAALVVFPSEKLVIAWASNIENEIDEFPVYKIAMNFINFINGNKVDQPNNTLKTRKDALKDSGQK